MQVHYDCHYPKKHSNIIEIGLKAPYISIYTTELKAYLFQLFAMQIYQSYIIKQRILGVVYRAETGCSII